MSERATEEDLHASHASFDGGVTSALKARGAGDPGTGLAECTGTLIDALVARQRVIDECVTPYLLDELDAWEMQSSGDYVRAREHGASAQQALMQLHGKVGH
jgi:hypothetical protein